MSDQDEFLELIQQAKAHAQYYQLLGITHVGSSNQARVEMPVQAVKPVEQKIITPPQPVAPPVSKPAPMVEVATATMPSSDKASLFGETASLENVNETPHETHNETLDDIRRDLGDCRRCKLWSTRTNLVFGEGNAQAQLMFVGEGPGADEDASGRPFIGRAGQLLTKMIEAIEFKREEVYIANVVKSRPPNNRTPEADEIQACRPFLWRQIAAIRPKLIVTLGNPATQLLLETKIGITQLRGKVQDYTRVPGIKVIPTFHPAYLLRSPDKKREAWEDLKKVRAYLRGEL
jgi:uracil-DNA glycosylase